MTKLVKSNALLGLALLVLVVADGPRALVAQEPEEPLFESLVNRFQTPAIGFGAVFQFVGDFQDERTFSGENGFSLANMRLALFGRLDRGFEYFFQSAFGSVLDARMSYFVGPGLMIDVGRFKAPTSAEFLIPAQSIDFVNRSQTVSALVPGRELGVQARGDLGGNGVGYSVGIFNAGGGLSGNSDGEFHYAGRVVLRPPVEGLGEDGTLEVGLNAAFNSGALTTIPPDEDPSFDHLRRLIGIDLRLHSGPWLVSGEVLGGTGRGTFTPDPWGLHLTGAYMIRDNAQLLARLDRFDPGFADEEARNVIVIGWNVWPTLATELQFNLLLPTRGFGEEPQLLANAQVSF